MSEYTLSARDFTDSSNFSWSAMIKKFDDEGKTKNYEIVDGNLVTPVEVRYSINLNRVSLINANSLSSFTSTDNLIRINEPTLEKFYESIKNNIDVVRSYYEWINTDSFLYEGNEEKIKDLKERYFIGAFKVVSVKPFITESTESVEGILFVPNDEIVIESSSIDIKPIIEAMDNHPEMENIKLSIKIREEEMKKLIIENQNRDREVVRQNNFQMWKLLNEKYIDGEFNDLLNK
jgi:hypothetical protein